MLILFFIFQLQAQVETPQAPYLINGYDDVLRQAENTGLFERR